MVTSLLPRNILRVKSIAFSRLHFLGLFSSDKCALSIACMQRCKSLSTSLLSCGTCSQNNRENSRQTAHHTAVCTHVLWIVWCSQTVTDECDSRNKRQYHMWCSTTTALLLKVSLGGDCVSGIAVLSERVNMWEYLCSYLCEIGYFIGFSPYCSNSWFYQSFDSCVFVSCFLAALVLCVLWT